MKRNQEQELAYLNEPLSSVTANAGSGKTAVLVDKYLKILLEVKDPSKIITFTFTNKAASELGKKVNKKLNQLLQNEKDSSKRESLLLIKNKFIQSRISTIHSFCSKLVREYPVELGLSPSVKDLSKVESHKLLKRVVKQCIKSSYENELRSDLDRLLIHFDTKTLEDQLIENIRKRHLYKYLDNIYQMSDNEIISHYKNQINSYYLQEISRLKFIINGILKDCSIDDDLFEKINLFNSDLKKVQIDNLFQFVEDLNGKKYKVGRKGLPGAISHLENIPNSKSEEIENIFKALKDSLKIYNSLNIEKEEISFFRSLYKLSINALKHFQEFKINNSLVDYNDLLIYASNLLDDKEIHTKVSNGFDYLFIDEFQDTAYLQYDLISKLAKIGSEDPKPIFIVGDTKQSIYGFNNADVRIFKNVSEQFSKINPSNVITLKTSYRLHPIPAMFVNDVMRNLMTNSSEYDVEYDELVIGIDESKKSLVNDLKNNVELGNTMGEVELLIVEPDENDEEENLLEKECDLVSKKIHQLVQNDNYDFSDITVLFRNGSKLNHLLKSFKKYGIQYESFGNKNLFKRQEITDLISYLSFLLDPYDDLNFAILLKSYFFGLNDDELLQIQYSEGDSLYEKFITQSDKNDKYKKIKNYLSEMIRKSFISSPTVIANDLINHSNYYDLLNPYPQKEQINQNIKKVLNLILDGNEIDNSSLFNLVNSLEDNHNLSDETEAELNHKESRVNLSTVHASKGLEYKCLILFNTDFKSNSDKGIRIDEFYGFYGGHFKYSNNEKSYHESPLNKIIANNLNIQDNAENKRLLYVALTRCKEKLIISSSFKNSTPSKSGFAKLILDGLSLTIEDLYSNDELQRSSKITFDNEGERSKSLIKKYKIKITKEIEIDILKDDKREHEAFRIPEYDIKYDFQRENFTASKLNHFIKDKQAYFDRYYLGLPEFKELELKGIFKDADLNDSEIVASLKGTVFHEVIENISYYYDVKVNDDDLIKQIEYSFKNNKHIATDDEIKEISNMIHNVLKADFIKDKIDAIKSSEKELELRWNHDNDFLFGSIDLLFNTGNEFEIWDWKTNKVNNIEELVSTALTYEMQMKLYVYLVSLRHPNQDTYKARLLFTQQASKLSEWVYTFEFTKEDLIDIKREIDFSVKGIRDLAY